VFSIVDVLSEILLKKNLLVLLVIAIVAGSFSLASYQYSTSTSDEIGKIATEDIVSTAQDEAYDLSRVVINKIDSITTNLQVLANAPSIQSGDASQIVQLFDAAQYSTEEITEYYMWLDLDGNVKMASNIARAVYQYQTTWHGEKPPFLTEPQRTGSIYYSEIIKSPNDISRVYIAYPIVYSLNQNEQLAGDFRGVIVASIRLDTLGTLLTSELSPTFESDVSLVDNSGAIVYSVDKSALGKNIFDDPVYLTTPILPELDESVRLELTQFLKQANTKQQAGVKNVNLGEQTFSLAYQPIIHNDNHFWTIYIIAPHIVAGNVVALLAKQDAFVAITLIVVGLVSTGIAYLILSWNKKLERIVKERTLELKQSNTLLEKSNNELVLANEQLKTHESMQREFVNIAAHELRTPIMPILGMTDILEAQYLHADEIKLKRKDFDIISRNARRLEKLATDILDVTRIETQSLQLHKESLNVREIIELAVDDIKRQFTNNNVSFQVSADHNLVIYADRGRLIQVLINLLSNSAKFTDEGTITIRARIEVKEPKLLISVIDTGIGIDPDIMPRLFTKFVSKSGEDRAQIGSGLGLFVSKSIVEAHGGKIWAENNEVRGTAFHVELPLYENNQLKSLDIWKKL